MRRYCPAVLGLVIEQTVLSHVFSATVQHFATFLAPCLAVVRRSRRRRCATEPEVLNYCGDDSEVQIRSTDSVAGRTAGSAGSSDSSAVQYTGWQ